MPVIIRSIGKALPQKRVSNDDLPKELETSDEWIRSHTGIGARYIVGENENVVSLGVKACLETLKETDVKVEDINLLICSTTTSAYAGFPSTACVMQKELKAVNATCFDITAACSGFLYGVNTAVAMMELNGWKYGIVCGSEILSKISDWTDRSTCVLFGDGAGAFLLERTEEGKPGIGAFVSGSDGTGDKSLFLDPADGFLKMDGHAVYNFAVGAMSKSIKDIMEKENLSESDVDYFVCHQANERILSAAAKRLGFEFEKFICAMKEYGNTSSASIPIALTDLKNQGKIKKGTVIVSAAFGAGLTWAGTVFRF